MLLINPENRFVTQLFNLLAVFLEKQEYAIIKPLKIIAKDKKIYLETLNLFFFIASMSTCCRLFVFPMEYGIS